MCSLALVLMLISCLVACNKTKSEENKAETKSEFGFDSKVATKEDEDGWTHFFSFEYDKNSGELLNCAYNVYNLKYKEIEGYTIDVIDESGEIVETYVPVLPYISLDSKYDSDFKALNSFLDNKRKIDDYKQWNIEGLELENIDKDMVTELFYAALEGEKLPDGKYSYLLEADVVKEKKRDGYCWQVGYMVFHGVVTNVNIELIYDDEYLSDILHTDKATDSQKKLSKILDDIEKKIITNQCFELGVISEEIQAVDFDRLDKLLSEIEEGTYN